jgi:dihydroorotate dehydrogenase electron transfer subunit
MKLQAGARVLGRVASTERLGAFCWMTVEVSGWVESGPGLRRPGPGQFALLQAEPSCCFLPRAFSISDYDERLVSFLIAPVGEGSRELSALSRGAEVWVLGPLGRGFDLGAMAAADTADSGSGRWKSPSRLVVVAGGAGLAPFPFLLRRIGDMVGQGPGTAGARFTEVLVLVGYRDSAQVPGGRPVQVAAERLRRHGVACEMVEISEDGSCGPAGLVTAPLAENLRTGDRVVVCGPEAMAAAVWEVCRRTSGVAAWFSLEAGMACGVGACHGCSIRLSDGTMARVCYEGPVFPGAAVFAVEGMVRTGTGLSGSHACEGTPRS